MSLAARRLNFLSARSFSPGYYSTTFSTSQKTWLTKLNSKYPSLVEIVSNELIVKQDFVTEKEESSLISELDSVLCKRKYQTKHWDYAIKNFRELERKSWHSTTNQLVISRLKASTTVSNGLTASATAMEADVANIDQLVLPLIHVLDLAENGEIMAHVDSVKFCGESIAVLSLLSDSILRLAVAPQSEVVGVPQDQYDYLNSLNLPPIGSWIDIFIPRRSVYIMRGALRYLLTHAILSNEQVDKIRNEQSIDLYNLHRGRRVSVICRTHSVCNLIPYYNNVEASSNDVNT
ncbi:unnamed protein product [Schistosoma curassoni]|uniref:Alpha-ketoglutarate-dependent dioxygenase alkB homolog 7, mitochondrial n=2 Tax=Schistosoma TaxID=6181 RepID=A0A183KG77_9TREM|nr:unnamed protein product [Schistosoma curassoni]VDP54957.1 unnamed protein product [Schistosoma curassoni]